MTGLSPVRLVPCSAHNKNACILFNTDISLYQQKLKHLKHLKLALFHSHRGPNPHPTVGTLSILSISPLNYVQIFHIVFSPDHPQTPFKNPLAYIILNFVGTLLERPLFQSLAHSLFYSQKIFPTPKSSVKK